MEPGNNAFQEIEQGGKSRIESVCLPKSRPDSGRKRDRYRLQRVFSELKKYIIGTFDEECGILLKDDAELKKLLSDPHDNDHKQIT